MKNSRASFEVGTIQNFDTDVRYDLVICSRVMHFAATKKEFETWWDLIRSYVREGGLLYASMDSTIENTLAKKIGEDQFEFPDGMVRLALTDGLYDKMKKGFDEVEPLKTIVHHKARAQSFMLLKKN